MGERGWVGEGGWVKRCPLAGGWFRGHAICRVVALLLWGERLVGLLWEEACYVVIDCVEPVMATRSARRRCCRAQPGPTGRTSAMAV